MAEETWLGLEFDDYAIERMLGRGGMAAVFKARDVKLDRHVAVKILPAAALGCVELMKRFEREAKVVAKISHPNVAQVYRIGEVRGRPYYAMELIEGPTLAELLKEKGKVGPLQAVEFITQAAKGLRAAAQQGIIHRDVKPANIMVTREGVVKILDFGIAKAATDDTFQTQAGAIMGTPRYMSPEQGKGLAIDQRSDIYALGATAYHLLAGVPPFEADNAVTLMLKHMQEPVRSITQFNDHVPYRLCNVIYGMLAKKPEDRIRDYDELIAALGKVFQEAEKENQPCGSADWLPENTPSPGPARWKHVAAIAGVAVLLVAGAIVSFSRSDQKEQPAAAAAQELRDKDQVTLGGTLSTLQKLDKFSKEARRDRDLTD